MGPNYIDWCFDSNIHIDEVFLDDSDLKKPTSEPGKDETDESD